MLNGEFISNATVTVEKKTLVSKLAMIKFEKAFDFLSEEPLSITIKNEINSEEKLYMRNFRVRLWQCNGESASWSVYSQDRAGFEDIVIRKVIWNMDQDVAAIKNCELSERENLLNRGPTISSINKYISVPQAKIVNKSIKNLDNELEKDFSLKESLNPKWEWRDLELLRLFDWGEIHLVWSPYKTNKIIEGEIKKILEILNKLIEENTSTIPYMALNFEIPIEKYNEIYSE